MRYGTFQEIANMDLGVTGTRRTINDVQFEQVRSDDAIGWVALGLDANGDILQVDPVSEAEAVELGLIARQPTNRAEWQQQYS
jgi:hypothetical protein